MSLPTNNYYSSNEYSINTSPLIENAIGRFRTDNNEQAKEIVQLKIKNESLENRIKELEDMHREQPLNRLKEIKED